MNNKKIVQVFKYIIIFLFPVIFPKPVYAYLDPGTGSLITQAVAGFLLAAIFTVKLWLGKLKQFFNGKK